MAFLTDENDRNPEDLNLEDTSAEAIAQFFISQFKPQLKRDD